MLSDCSHRDLISVSDNKNNNVASMDSFSVADTLPVRKMPPKPPPFYFDSDKQQTEHQQDNSKTLVSIRAYEERIKFDFQPTKQVNNESGTVNSNGKAVRFTFGEEGKLASQVIF